MKKKWCLCDEFPIEMCNQWPACVDLNGRIWGAEESFQKYRKRNQKKHELASEATPEG